MSTNLSGVAVGTTALPRIPLPSTPPRYRTYGDTRTPRHFVQRMHGRRGIHMTVVFTPLLATSIHTCRDPILSPQGQTTPVGTTGGLLPLRLSLAVVFQTSGRRPTRPTSRLPRRDCPDVGTSSHQMEPVVPPLNCGTAAVGTHASIAACMILVGRLIRMTELVPSLLCRGEEPLRIARLVTSVRDRSGNAGTSRWL